MLNVRPYAKVTGPRQVPILASANGIPFLRLTKPQPPALSRVIRQRLKRRIDLFDIRTLLANWWLPLSQHEDEWDALINEQLKQREDQTLWIDAIHMAAQKNQAAYEVEIGKDRDITRKMQKIVDSETKLALEEGETIVRGRRRKPIFVVKP